MTCRGPVICGVIDTFLHSWNSLLDCLERQPSLRRRWKSNKQGMVHMKVFTGPYSAPHSFFLFFPPFCMSCHLEGCVSSAVLASWRRDPSSSCSGERDYSNPTPLGRLTIIIIIISPKRSIICSDAAAAVLNGRLINPIQLYFGVCFWFCLLESQREKKKWLSLVCGRSQPIKRGEKMKMNVGMRMRDEKEDTRRLLVSQEKDGRKRSHWKFLFCQDSAQTIPLSPSSASLPPPVMAIVDVHGQRD